ncbi:hypothetical protein H5410_053473 [Solanum commersonii]|uniref:C2H2-type domain-containing protein n=1 Tax=Solanum commersonii TaxID=4109 RepID=A0A9J5X6H5_SOLCO|nr:hypothetical protein H5410_053473 [Solanum commersonii]
MEKSDQIVTWSSEELLGLGHVKFYRCSFCKRGFSNAQALGGHMNIHRRDRARLREFSSDQNLLSLDIKNSIYPPPRPRNDDLLQREVSLYDEGLICSPSKRPCVKVMSCEHNPPPPHALPHDVLLQREESSYGETIISSPLKRPCVKVMSCEHNPPPRPPPPALPHDVLLQREESLYGETIISSPSKRPCVKVSCDHNPPPPPHALPHDVLLQREGSLYGETIISSPSKRPCVKVSCDHNPPPHALPHDVLLQREVLSSYDETIISSPSKRPCFTYDQEKDHYDHNLSLVNDDSLQREVSSYDETIISSSSKRPCVTYDEENDHLITSKVNCYDHNHEVISGDLLQLPLFKETPLVRKANNCMENGKVENKGMEQTHVSILDLELRLGMEPPESSTETDLRFELHKF